MLSMTRERSDEAPRAAGRTAYDVVVVGFGPSGAVAAGLLGQAGLSTLVCDSSATIYPMPRAIALDHEILRVFQELAVLDEVLPHVEPFTDSLYYGASGQLIKRLSTLPEPWPMAFPPSAVFSQPAVEAAIRNRVARLPSVSVELGVTLVALTQNPSGVLLELQADGGTKRRIEARYVIGCDGARSTVRELADMRLDDLGFDESWLVVDAVANERGLAKLPQTSVQYCEPERPCSFVIGPHQHRRWEFALNAGDDPRFLATPEGSWRLLARWLEPADATLWRQATYRFHALVAREWRNGRVFIAGDAAHQQPPFLGQGMCQGIRDAKNLSWKLAAVLDGRAQDSLLDTYATERKRHVECLTERIKQFGALICERDPVVARERDARLLAAGEVRPQPRQDLQPALEGGCLSSAAHPARGTLLPQPWVVDPESPGGAVRLDTLTGAGWRLVLGEPLELPELPPALETRLQLTMLCASDYSASTVRELDGVLSHWLRSHAALAVLVRPDHYVFGVARTRAELSSLFDGISRFYV